MELKSKYMESRYVSRYVLTTNGYLIRNKKDKGNLGCIEYYKPYKSIAFFPDPNTVFSDDCLQDLVNFLKELNGGE